MAGESGERTEKATPQRLKKARSEGNLARSTDLSTWVVVGAAVVLLPNVMVSAAEAFGEQMRALTQVASEPTTDRAVRALSWALGSLPGVLATFLLGLLICAVLASMSQGGMYLATGKLKPSFKKLNPINGFKQIFGLQ